MPNSAVTATLVARVITSSGNCDQAALKYARANSGSNGQARRRSGSTAAARSTKTAARNSISVAKKAVLYGSLANAFGRGPAKNVVGVQNTPSNITNRTKTAA